MNTPSGGNLAAAAGAPDQPQPPNGAAADPASVLEAALGSDHDLALFVGHVMGQMHDQFTAVSESILAKIDEFGAEISNMEQRLLEAGSSSVSSGGGGGGEQATSPRM